MIYLIDTSCFNDDFYNRIREAEKIIFGGSSESKNNRLSVCGRVLLGCVLHKHYSVSSFSYTLGENGKPYLKDKNIHFSISHSGDMILCCVTEKESGCDIERIRSFNPRVVRRFFTENEAKTIEGADDKDRLFIRIWTLKESILKKNGSGITGGLQSYCFADYAALDEFTAYGCNFLSASVGGYELSFCTEEKYTFSDIKALTADELEGYINQLNNKNS